MPDTNNIIANFDQLPEEILTELELTLREDIVARYHNQEYWDLELIKTFLRDRGYELAPQSQPFGQGEVSDNGQDH